MPRDRYPKDSCFAAAAADEADTVAAEIAGPGLVHPSRLSRSAYRPSRSFGVIGFESGWTAAVGQMR